MCLILLQRFLQNIILLKHVIKKRIRQDVLLIFLTAVIQYYKKILLSGNFIAGD